MWLNIIAIKQSKYSDDTIPKQRWENGFYFALTIILQNFKFPTSFFLDLSSLPVINGLQLEILSCVLKDFRMIRALFGGIFSLIRPLFVLV